MIRNVTGWCLGSISVRRHVKALPRGGIYADKARCKFLYYFVILINLIIYAMLSLVSANYYPHKKMATCEKMGYVLIEAIWLGRLSCAMATVFSMVFISPSSYCASIFLFCIGKERYVIHLYLAAWRLVEIWMIYGRALSIWYPLQEGPSFQSLRAALRMGYFLIGVN